MTALDPDTFMRATEIVLNEQLVGHEAGHAAAAMLTGLDVEAVRAPFHTLDTLEQSDPNEAAGEAVIYSPTPNSRAFAVAVLAGPMCDGSTYWPPRFPPTLAPLTPDEKQVGDCVRALDLDHDGYTALCDEARALTESPAFKRLHRLIVDELAEPPHQIGRAHLRHLKSIAERADMEHLALKAAVTTVTDQGVFEAVISTESVDREKDIVDADGMVKALRKWPRQIPVTWEHSTKPEDIFGHIDPRSVKNVNGEVVAEGQVDLDSKNGADAWRSFKARRVGFSFAYLVLDATDRENGGRHIRSLDIFEITATRAPMNNDTRVIGTKSVDLDLDHVRAEWRDTLAGVFSTSPPETLREKSTRIAREHAPITIATFDA